MPEVRSIPSAVGAYEAQVIDFSGIPREMARVAQAKEKQRAEQAADLDKSIEKMIGNKGGVRPQDTEYINDLEKELYNFYYNNKKSILAGGKEKIELNERMGKVRAEINRSSGLFKTGLVLIPTMKSMYEKGGEMSDEGKQALDAWQLPINDPRRQSYTIPGPGGTRVAIDNFNVDNLDWTKPFDEKTDLTNKFAKQDYRTKTIKELGGKNKYGFVTDETMQVRYVLPGTVEQVVKNVSVTKGNSFSKHYETLFEQYKQQYAPDVMAEDFKGVADAYSDITGFDITTMFKSGKVNTAYEYALFTNLKRNIPQVVKDTYDYATQNMLFRQQSLDIARSRNALGWSKFNWQQTQNETLQQQIAQMLSSEGGPSNIAKINDYINANVAIADLNTGGGKNFEVETVHLKGKYYQHNLKARVPLLSLVTGNPITSQTEAEDVFKSSMSKMQGWKGVIKSFTSDGQTIYYGEYTQSFHINYADKGAANLVDSKILTVASEVSNSDALRKSLDSKRKKIVPDEQTTTPFQNKGRNRFGIGL